VNASGALRVLVADDEVHAREHVRTLLQRAEGVEVVGSTDNGQATITAIERLQPDLLFLDVQMPDMSGFDVIKGVDLTLMPITVFVTAYDQYALKAFDAAAIDYLLKPFSDERFEQALDRARQLCRLRHFSDMVGRVRQATEYLGAVGNALPRLDADSGYLQRIAVESRGQVRAVPVEQIEYVTASGVYAELHVGDRTYVVRERMQSLEERLDPRQFFRVHRSAIVRLSRIDVLLRQAGGDYTLRLKNGAEIAVSRNRIRQLEEWMGIAPHASQA
jgi:two-component system, LytTR family, response regulator